MKRGIILFIIVSLTLFPLVFAEDLFGATPTHVSVGYQGSANIGYDNLQNWPPDVIQQFKDTHDRILAKCKSGEYDSWSISRAISGSDSGLYHEKLFGTSDFESQRKEMQKMESYDVDRWNQAFRDASAVPGSNVLTYSDVIESEKCPAPQGPNTIVNVYSEVLSVSRSSSADGKTNSSKTYSATFSCQTWDCEKTLIPPKNIPLIIESINPLIERVPPKFTGILGGKEIGILVTGKDGVNQQYLVSFEGSKIKSIEKAPPTKEFSITIKTSPEFMNKLVKSGNPSVTIQQAVKNGNVVLSGSGITNKAIIAGLNLYLTPAKKEVLETFTVNKPTNMQYNGELALVTPRVENRPIIITLPSRPTTPIVSGAQGNVIGYTTLIAQWAANQLYQESIKGPGEGLPTYGVASRYSNNAGVYRLNTNNNPPQRYSPSIPLSTNNNAKNMYAGLTYGAGAKVATTTTTYNLAKVGRR